jgi:hypothetical protein
MKAFVIIFLIFLSFNQVFGQINYNDNEGGIYQTGNIDTPFLRVSQSSGNNIVGSIYINENWEQAVITDSVSNNVKLMARFNAYHGEIELLRDKTIGALLPVEGIRVLLNNKKFVPLQLQDKSKSIFVEIVVDGNQNLYRKYSIKINKAPSDAKLLNLESADKVVIVYDLYIKNHSGEVLELPLRKKEIEEILSKEMIDLAKREKLSLKKEKDVVELFKLSNAMKK